MESDIPKRDLLMRKFQPLSQEGVVEQASDQAASSDSLPNEPPSTVEDKIDPKDLLSRSLSDLADRMRQNQTGWLAQFGFVYIDDRFGELRHACREFQIEFLGLSDDPDTLLQFSSKIDDLQASYSRLRFRLVQVPSFVVITAAMLDAGLIVSHWGVIEHVQNKMQIRRVMRYGYMAVAGALIWGITSMMTRRQSAHPDGRHEISLFSVSARFFVAIVFATIIVMLTSKKDGTPLKFGQIWKSPETSSFLAGYSCQIIILGLNKLVEKVSKMLESI